MENSNFKKAAYHLDFKIYHELEQNFWFYFLWRLVNTQEVFTLKTKHTYITSWYMYRYLWSKTTFTVLWCANSRCQAFPHSPESRFCCFYFDAWKNMLANLLSWKHILSGERVLFDLCALFGMVGRVIVYT